MIVDNYIAGISDNNPDTELLNNDVLTHPKILDSWTLKLNHIKDIRIDIYKVENVEIKL